MQTDSIPPIPLIMAPETDLTVTATIQFLFRKIQANRLYIQRHAQQLKGMIVMNRVLSRELAESIDLVNKLRTDFKKPFVFTPRDDDKMDDTPSPSPAPPHVFGKDDSDTDTDTDTDSDSE